MPETLDNDSDARVASRIYVDDSIQLKPKYKRSINRKNIREVDFAEQYEKTRLNINNWVKRRTNGLIPDLIAEGLLTPETLFVLVNALYFKGSWKKPFSKETTETGTFHGIDGNEKVEFMVRRNFIMSYKEVPSMGGSMMSLPYKESNFWFYIFLPETQDGWKEAEKEFESIAGSVFDTDYSRQEVAHLKMPKWESETSLDKLTDVLSNLGISSVFSGSANFSEITESAAIPVSDIIHKAKITVDEEVSLDVVQRILSICGSCRERRPLPRRRQSPSEAPFDILPLTLMSTILSSISSSVTAIVLCSSKEHSFPLKTERANRCSASPISPLKRLCLLSKRMFSMAMSCLVVLVEIWIYLILTLKTPFHVL